MLSDHPRVQVLRALRRALALRCPRCGETPLFPGARGMAKNAPPAERSAAVRVADWLAGWFVMTPACALCGLRFERAQGYWVGAIYVNYAVTVMIAVGGYLLLWNLAGLPTGWQLALWVPFVIAFPLWFFRYSRSLWLALELLVNPEL